MDYEKKYKEALEWMQSVYSSLHGATKEDAEHYFPELKESEDERIRKAIIDFLRLPHPQFVGKRDHEKWIAWLEKQGKRDARYENLEELLEADTEYQVAMNDAMVEEAKTKAINALSELQIGKLLVIEKQGEQPTDKIDTKFKTGDWIVDNKTPHDVFCVIEVLGEIYKVIDIDGDDYHIPHCKADTQFHLWTINDANDGDVLAMEPIDGYPFPFVALYKEHGLDFFNSYCFIGFDGKFYEADEGHSTGEIHPATKEQRNLLFQKMKEAGYEWDSEKKELKKIKALDADKVIEWLKNTIIETKEYFGEHNTYYNTRLTLPYDSIEDLINNFKENFGL